VHGQHDFPFQKPIKARCRQRVRKDIFVFQSSYRAFYGMRVSLLELLVVANSKPARSPHQVVGPAVGSIAIQLNRRVEDVRRRRQKGSSHQLGQRTNVLFATFDLSFMRAETHMRINKGVFVIVLFATFLDGSGRANYLNREFFYRQP